MDLGLTLTLPEGNTYAGTWTLRMGECTGLDDLDLRKETGLTVFGLFDSLVNETGMGAIVAAAILWLTRRKEFAHFTFQDAARAVPWNTDFTLVDADQAAEPEGKVEGSEPEPETSA